MYDTTAATDALRNGVSGVLHNHGEERPDTTRRTLSYAGGNDPIVLDFEARDVETAVVDLVERIAAQEDRRP